MPMVSKLGRLWKLIATAETVDKFADAAAKVFELAATLKDEDNLKNSQIKQFVESIPTLLEALNSPLGQVVKSTVPFLPIATAMIQFGIEANSKEPTVAETVAIVAQVAYLESVSNTLPSELISEEEQGKKYPQVEQQLQQLADLAIDYESATLALVYFHESEIATAFNGVLTARLEATGMKQSEVETWVDKVALNTQGYISQALAEAGKEIEVVSRILDWYTAGGKAELAKRRSINYYLEQEIKSLPEKSVFREKFSFRDIYVPLKGVELNSSGKKVSNAQEFVLASWAQEFIADETKSQQVLFIQAAAGRGKSVFCRLFADWVRQNRHPQITPILIRLRDIQNYNRPIDKILSSALSNRDFVKNDPAWLTDSSTRYLFLLDGFDELRMEGRATGGIAEFIRQVGQFQRDYSSKETGHRLIVTGRPIALRGIFLPPNLSRVELLPMNDEIQEQWFKNWAKVVIPDNPMAGWQETEKFKAFLRADSCPTEIKEKLAREPLLLYLLAKLHRPDGEGKRQIQQADFDNAGNKINAKILVYEQSLALVLKEQRQEWLQHQIIGLDIETLERILMEAGLCVVQSGGEYSRVEMIENRLAKDDPETATIIQKLRAENGEQALSTALGAFYIRAAGGAKGGGVEFYHKSFSEFLAAKRLLISLEEWTAPGRRRKKWAVDDEQIAKEIYDLLGYGGLTPEIVEYLWGLLTKSAEFPPVELFQRLLNFYEGWCEGEFIDAEETILPHLKMKELRQQLPDRESYLGQRQVDVYAGLNIMILLLEIHRYGGEQTEDIQQQLTFYPCGKPNANQELEDATRLRRLIHYSDCIGDDGFRDVVGRFLKGADLRGANFRGANLDGADLDGADLRGADLRGANFRGANLYGANLRGADFRGANLYGADLRGADLYGAYLKGANLYGADLSAADLDGADLYGAYLRRAYLSRAYLEGAYLSRAYLEGANLEGANLYGANLKGANLYGANLANIQWNPATTWTNARGLEEALNVPEDLKQQLGLRVDA